MVTNKAAIGYQRPQVPGGTGLAPLPPPARAPQLEMGRAFAVPSLLLGRLRGIFFGAATGFAEQYRNKDKTMEALLMHGFGQSPPSTEPESTRSAPETRIARSATIFAAIYLALVLGSPLIVRYGPSPDDHAMAALVTRMEQPRCASAPESSYACPGRTLAARDVDNAKQPDF